MFDIISAVMCVVIICLVAGILNQLSRIKALQKQINDVEDSIANRISNSEDYCFRQIRTQTDKLFHKLDDCLLSRAATENRVSDLASRVWMVEGNVETLKPYIKKMQLKQLAQTAGTIHKNTLKELKAIENELK